MQRRVGWVRGCVCVCLCGGGGGGGGGEGGGLVEYMV